MAEDAALVVDNLEQAIHVTNTRHSSHSNHSNHSSTGHSSSSSSSSSSTGHSSQQLAREAAHNDAAAGDTGSVGGGADRLVVVDMSGIHMEGEGKGKGGGKGGGKGKGTGTGKNSFSERIFSPVQRATQKQEMTIAPSPSPSVSSGSSAAVDMVEDLGADHVRAGVGVVAFTTTTASSSSAGISVPLEVFLRLRGVGCAMVCNRYFRRLQRHALSAWRAYYLAVRDTVEDKQRQQQVRV